MFVAHSVAAFVLELLKGKLKLELELRMASFDMEPHDCRIFHQVDPGNSKNTLL
jgi:hypothetical protein